MAKNEALKRAIENIKLSHKILQSDIARIVGVKNTYLSDVINGRVPLSENLAEKFSEQFQIDKSLLTGEGEMLKSADNITDAMNPQNAMIIPIEVWDVIRNQAESLKTKDKQMDSMLESLMIKDQQTTDVIEMLKKNQNAKPSYHAANSVVVEDE